MVMKPDKHNVQHKLTRLCLLRRAKPERLVVFCLGFVLFFCPLKPEPLLKATSTGIKLGKETQVKALSHLLFHIGLEF